MELKQVKALLHQTECGEMFMDGMGCSEPILTQGNAGLIDNFFVYLVDKPAGTASGPLARMGLQAESGALSYFISANEHPFSVPPSCTIHVSPAMASSEDYENYSSLYAEIRKFVFKQNCTDSERSILSDYLTALKKYCKRFIIPFLYGIGPSFLSMGRKGTL